MTLHSTDQNILETAIDWIQQGYTPALVTVAKTWGSSPRPAGSLMLMRDDGIHVGSVSGGCVEEDLVARYRDKQLSETFPTMIDYGVDKQQATRFGLPCGGRLELCIEQLESTEQLNTLLNKCKRNEIVTRRVCLNTGEVSLHKAQVSDEFSYTANDIKKVFGPRWQMLIIGAGHLSQYVAQMAGMLDYHVIICDPREEYRQAWSLKDIELINTMPDDAVTQYASHPRSIVLALTHDPKLDDMALMNALTSNAFYIGALGSKRNNDSRRERLKTLGVTPQQLQRLHGPVGLDIGSHTPPEIAISILAEITAERHKLKRVHS